MPNWANVLTTNLLERLGSDCTTLRDMALAFGKELKEEISVDALFNAHKRHKDKLDLRPSLMDYMQGEEKEKPLGINDIKWSLSDDRKAHLESVERYIITSAMNNCEVDKDFWAAVQNYAKKNKAEIIVVPVRYINPTSRIDGKIIDEGAWWEPKLYPYLTDDMLKLHKHLQLMAQVRVQATAANPLTGLETLSRGASMIFGHSQVAMKTVPTPQHHLPKLMYTTGSCTVPIYSETKVGIRGEANHTIGALIVEKDGSRFHCRNVSSDESGGFYDLNYYYGPKKVEKSSGVLALITGDEHAMFSDTANRNATYLNKNSIAKVLNPEKIVRHDVFDGYSISHHNRHDPIIQYSKHKNGHHLVKDELELTMEYIEETTPKGAENIIVASNHHDHLRRWLKESHPAQEPWNADMWLELWGLLKNTIEFRERGVVYKDPFALWMQNNISVPTRFLDRDTEENVAGVLIGFHGDKGSNGSRGSLNQYAALGAKTVIGHSHSPGIKYGAYQVGTSSTLRLEYTSGPSSWAHCHCVIYPNGERQLIFVIDGHWRKE